jgi:5-methylcytosine-specific restriction endonuclease McrA
LARYASKKSKYKRLNKQWKKRNKGLVNATAAKRNSAKLLRTVAWANLEKIKEIYKNCPKGMVVDHIIPLQGKLVSGLHVENNLQYLTPSENNRKSNKYNVA